MLHQSITKIRAGAHGELKCEFSEMKRVPSCPETGHLSFYKSMHKLLFLPFPTKKNKEKKHKISLAKKKKVDIKKIKMFFMHISSA